MLKEYIVIRNHIPLGLAINSSAHASLQCHLKFEGTPVYDEWLATSFRKVVCVCNDKEFKKLKELPDSIVITESSLVGDDKEVGIVLAPRHEWPNVVKFLKLMCNT